MRSNSEKLIIRGTLLILLAVVGIIVVSFRESQQLRKYSGNLTAVKNRLFVLEELLLHTIDNTAQARGYVITGQGKYLMQQEKMSSAVRQKLEEVRKAYSGHAEKKGTIDSLAVFINSRLAFSEQSIQLSWQQGVQAAAQLLQNSKTEGELLNIRRIIHDLENHERNELSLLNSTGQKNFLVLNRLLLGSLLLILLFTAILLRITQKELARRKKDQAQLSQFNERLIETVKQKTREQAQVFERITDAFVALDKNWHYTYMNKKAGEIFNRDPEKMLGKNIWTEFPEGVGQPFHHAYEKAMREQQYVYLEEHYAPYNRWFENHIYPSPEGLSIFFKDISDRKKAELELQQSKAFIESISNASPDIIYIYDIEEHKNIYTNNGIQFNLGYTDAEIKQMGNKLLVKLMHPDDFSYYLERTYPRYFSLADGELLVHEYRMSDKQGNWHWLYCKESIYLRQPDGTPKQILGVTTDITERKKAEEKEKEVKDLLQSVFDSTIIGFSVLDTIRNEQGEIIDFRYNYASRATALMNNRYDLPGKIYSEVHSDFKKVGLFDNLKQVAETGEPGEMELYYEAEGFHNWFKTSSVKLKDGVVLCFEDITQRKDAEQQIFIEKVLSDSIINSLPGVFYLYNKAGKFLRWNKNFETVTGYSSEEIAQMHPLDFFDGDEKELLEEKIGSVFTSGADSVEANFVTKAKEKIPYFFTGNSIEYGDEICLLGVGIDISEQVKSQIEIEQYAMQLSQLAGHLQTIREEERKRISREIHDELGQQLTAIKMDLAWIDKKMPDDGSAAIKSKLSNSIGLLDESNLSIRKILNELRTGLLEHQELSEAIQFYAKQFSANTGIPVFIEIGNELNGTDEQTDVCLFRIFQESLTNIARHSEAKKVNIKLWQDEQGIHLLIEDDGKGFDSAMQRKKNSFGILGMSERVTALQGKFYLHTTPGRGTRIEVVIPRHK